jgi:antitoxin Phd
MTSQYNWFLEQGGFGMGSWQVQDAKARFSEFLDATIKKGPQIVTRRGIETAVLVPIGEWNRLRKAARPSLKDLLLAPGARFENLIPERPKLRRRTVREIK